MLPCSPWDVTIQTDPFHFEWFWSSETRSYTLQELADVVFAEALGEYTELELAWLQRLYETRATASPGTLSLQLVTDFISWNREVRRVRHLMLL